MDPTAAIAMLDRFLETNGEDVQLLRMNGSTVTAEAPCRGHVRGYATSELTVGMVQGQSHVILSPTDLDRAGWPGAAGVGDARVPRNGDRLVVQQRHRRVLSAEPKYLAGTLVRIDLEVAGPNA